jgi:prepilin-type processing-associated H-X9-DG protein
MEQTNAYNAMNFTRPNQARIRSGGVIINPNYTAFALAQSTFLCPSDANRTAGGISENNYRGNFGGSTPYAGADAHNAQTTLSTTAGGNGAFTIGQGLSTAQFTDGLSNTAFFSERIMGSGGNVTTQMPTLGDIVTRVGRAAGMPNIDALYQDCLSARRPDNFNFNAPGRFLPGTDFSDGWPYAWYIATLYNHVGTPNWRGIDCGSYSAIPDTPGEHAIISARSTHPGGVNVQLGDGSVKFVKDSTSLSVWRALGTRNGGETISADAF